MRAGRAKCVPKQLHKHKARMRAGPTAGTGQAGQCEQSNIGSSELVAHQAHLVFAANDEPLTSRLDHACGRQAFALEITQSEDLAVDVAVVLTQSRPSVMHGAGRA